MKTFILLQAGAAGLGILARSLHLAAQRYPRTTTTGPGMDVVSLLENIAWLVWALILLEVFA